MSLFPATFELSDLLPENGGDGSDGFVINGIDQGDRAGSSVSAAGNVNGEGAAGRSYVVFGRRPPKEPPAPADDTAQTDEDSAVTFSVFGNDSQGDSGPLIVTNIDTGTLQGAGL